MRYPPGYAIFREIGKGAYEVTGDAGPRITWRPLTGHPPRDRMRVKRARQARRENRR